MAFRCAAQPTRPFRSALPLTNASENLHSHQSHTQKSNVLDVRLCFVSFFVVVLLLRSFRYSDTAAVSRCFTLTRFTHSQPFGTHSVVTHWLWFGCLFGCLSVYPSLHFAYGGQATCLSPSTPAHRSVRWNTVFVRRGSRPPTACAWLWARELCTGAAGLVHKYG